MFAQFILSNGQCNIYYIDINSTNIHFYNITFNYILIKKQFELYINYNIGNKTTLAKIR